MSRHANHLVFAYASATPRERRLVGHERRRASVGEKPAEVRCVAASGAMPRPQLSAVNGSNEEPGLHFHLFEKSKV
jgi:hypothetical protein